MSTRSLSRAALAAGLSGLLAGALIARPVPGGARPHSPTPSPSPTPVADPAITLIARQQFVQWQAGVVNKKLYVPEVVPKLTDAKITETSHLLAQLGALTETVYIGRWINPEFPPDVRGYIYQMRCLSGNVYEWLSIDGQGKLDVFFKSRLDIENVTPAPSASPPAL
ncbi:MAG: hypothetical protein JO113_08795 [Candidatus Eremiobacteraeota bacterium]|nr:hypothetical protein [Candidatus Eremiobacteraeota bacterium]